MPRCARRVAESGYYHVMLRGNGKQVIFYDDLDRREFLRALGDAAVSGGLSLVAWCLMNNHVHLLLIDEEGHLSQAVHDLATRYAGYLNRRTGHVGSVFDGRFRSVPVESDEQLLAAVLYIHENPVKAGIWPGLDYPWSSYREYVCAREVEDALPTDALPADARLTDVRLTDVRHVLDLVGGPDAFAQISTEGRSSGYYFRIGARVPDEDVAEAARAAIYPLDPAELKSLEGPARNQALLAMRDEGLSVRQMERLTGIGRYAIEKGVLLARRE